MISYIDLFVFQEINSMVGQWTWLDVLAVFSAKYLGYVLIFGVLLLLFENRKKYWPVFFQAFAAAWLARFGIVELIRRLWERPRPFISDSVNVLLDHAATPAFPSGHAAFYFALSLVIYCYNKKAGLLFFLASFLICLSRVFCGIHWPSDILAGAVVGIFSAWLILFLFQRIVSAVRR